MKKIIVWTGAIAGMAGLAGLILINRPAAQASAAPGEQSTVATPKPFVQPPVPGSELPFNVYRVSAKNGGIIHYPTGSSVVIPANAFTSGYGNPLSDSIEIRYREFHDPLAIFLSGIPMEYDSAGLVRTFESAGMLEILAFDKGTPLLLKAQTPLQVKMASATPETRFNLYELDTVLKNWVYLGKDKVEKPAETKQVQPKRDHTRSFEPVDNSIRPSLADPQQYSFKIDYDKKEFPELAAYENVVFEVTDHNFKPAYFKINWNKISLYDSDIEGQYLIKLKKADTSISVMARPVFEKADYQHALAQFEQDRKQATMERDQKEFEQQAALNKVNKSLSTYNSFYATTTATSLSNLAAFRSFPVRRMGTFNADLALPPIIQYAYSFKSMVAKRVADNKTTNTDYNTIFLVEKGKNAVFRFAKGEPVKCDPNAQNLMWTVTDDKKIAFFRIPDYRRLLNGGENNIRPVPAKSQELAFEEIRKFSN